MTHLLRGLAHVPTGAPAVALLRHAARGPLPPDDPGAAVPITPEGERAAEALGRVLQGRLRTVTTSPVLRCVQTSEAVCGGAGVALDVLTSARLGDPGPYVVDSERAWQTFLSTPYDTLMDTLVGGGVVPGFADVDTATAGLVADLLDGAVAPGVHLHVSHDSIVGVCAHRLFRWPDRARWPGYLDALVLWRVDGTISAAWGEEVTRLGVLGRPEGVADAPGPRAARDLRR